MVNGGSFVMGRKVNGCTGFGGLEPSNVTLCTKPFFHPNNLAKKRQHKDNQWIIKKSSNIFNFICNSNYHVGLLCDPAGVEKCFR